MFWSILITAVIVVVLVIWLVTKNRRKKETQQFGLINNNDQNEEKNNEDKQEEVKKVDIKKITEVIMAGNLVYIPVSEKGTLEENVEFIFKAIEKWQTDNPKKRIIDIKYHCYPRYNYTEGVTLIIAEQI